MNWKGKIFAANMGDDTLSVVDPENRREVKRIPLESGSGPCDLVVWRKGLLIVQAFDNTLKYLNLTDDSFDQTIFVGCHPNFIALDMDTKKIYVSNADSDSIYMIGQECLQLQGQITVGSMPQGIDCQPQIRQMAVANMNSHDVWLIDTNEYEVISRIQVEGYPSQVLYSKDGDHLYVCTGYLEEQKEDNVVIINIKNGKVDGKIPVGSIPMRMVETRDIKNLLVTSTGLGELDVVDLLHGEVTKRIGTGGMAHGVILDPEENLAYVTNRDENTLSVVDWRKGEKLADISVGKEPGGLVYT
jgi:YVTN family beta-propeller protein